MSYYGDEIDFIIAHRLCNLGSRFPFDYYRFNFQAVEQLIGEEISNLRPELQ
jgi:hypothetical protein